MASRFVFKFHDLPAQSRFCFCTAISSNLRDHSLSPTRNLSEELVHERQRSYSQHCPIITNQTSTNTNYIQTRKKSEKCKTGSTKEIKQATTDKYEDAIESINNECLSEDNTYFRSINQPSHFAYELESMKSLTERNWENNYLFIYLTEMHKSHTARVLPHLQPQNIKPFNSNDNLVSPSVMKPRPTFKITYPENSINKHSKSTERKKEVSEVQSRKYSTIFKENPGFYNINKIAELIPNNVLDNKQNEDENEKLNNSDYSEFHNFQYSNKKSTEIGIKNIVPYPSYSEKIKSDNSTNSTEYIINDDKDIQKVNKSQVRNLCTDCTVKTSTKPQSETVKVKLNKQSKKKLPKLPLAENCPCTEKPPLADMKPLERPKMLYIPTDPDRNCYDSTICDSKRADDGLVVKKKKLPKIEVADCPCVEIILKDVPLKRLQKTYIPEPKRDLTHCLVEPCPPRADENLKIKPKKLPPIEAKECPCVPQDPLTDVPLVRLESVKIPDPPKICPTSTPCPPRADDNLKVKSKTLPVMSASDCPCIEAEHPELLPPLQRLKKIHIEEPPKICTTSSCADNPRADDGRKVNPKKLPVIEAKECPCIPEEPLVSVPLGRPKMTYKPMDKEKVCTKSSCKDNPRADDGMKIKDKRLPKLVPGESCPCTEKEIKKDTPLLRLVPRSVTESNFTEICIEKEPCPPRADKNLEIKTKCLPVLKAGYCPCVEKDELKDTEPLKRLYLEFKDPPKQCPVKTVCDVPRSDDNLEITPKKLPELSVSNCPCVEKEPLKDCPPLSRLPKITYPVLERTTPTPMCDLIPRSDKDDWAYWKSSNTKRKTVNLINKRKHYTNSFDKRLTYNKLSNIFSPNLEFAVPIHNNLYVSNGRLNSLNQDDGYMSLNNDISRFTMRYKSTDGKKCNTCKTKKLNQDTKNNKIIESMKLSLPYAERVPFKKTDECSIKKQVKDCKEVEPCKAKAEQRKEECFTVWERIQNYFKARPCPSPEEFRRMRLKRKAQIAAEKAGLCIYDPKDFEEELSHMLTSEICNNKCKDRPNLCPDKIGKSDENKCSINKNNIDKVRSLCCQQQSNKKNSGKV